MTSKENPVAVGFSRCDTERMSLDPHRAANLANWDSRVDIHYRSDLYSIADYLNDPTHLSSIVEFDRHRIGDVSGARLIHLQCHIGTDTVSWARLGADDTGTDFSPNAVEAARRLSADSGTPARFILSELYETPSVVDEKFDIVYTGVGAICWLPDIRRWAEVVAGLLEEGGRLYIREGHPLMWALDLKSDDELRLAYPYFEGDPTEFVSDETYSGPGVVTSPRTFDWNHGVGEVLTGLIDAGMRIDRVEEYDFCEWQALPSMVVDEQGHWRLPEDRIRYPLMWSILATRI